MDAIEILGGILGNKSGGSGAGAKILKDIIFGGGGGAKPQAAPPKPQAPSQPSSRRGSVSDSQDIAQQAKELEDLLNVANKRSSRTTVPAPVPQPTQRSSVPAPNTPPSVPRFQKPTVPPPPPPRRAEYSEEDQQQEQAVVLIRAMINGAKADGQITRDEQQRIIEQLNDPSQAAIDFLRQEFSQPLDVRAFAWSVPLGMEVQVYTMTLLGMKLDSDPEAQYLIDLAHGLRLAPEICDEIHRRYNAPGLQR